jgi:hypothetical protein
MHIKQQLVEIIFCLLHAFSEEEIGQSGNILGSLPQGGNIKGKHVEPVA